MTSERIPHPHLRDEASTDALPVSPALGASLDAARMPVTAAQPSNGGAAPAIPPITMFCGVSRLRHAV